MMGGSSRRAAAERAGRKGRVWGAGEARWQRDQRTRRRRMTQRGRATLLSTGLAGALGLLWLAEPFASVGAATPPVSAAAPAADAAADPGPPRAPDFVLERLPMTNAALELPVTGAHPEAPLAGTPGHLFERVSDPAGSGDFTVEYTLDAELTREVFGVLRQARAALGNVIVLDPRSGRVLAYAATDTERFPPTRSYPAASLVKIITAAAALDRTPDVTRLKCRYRGSPYRLTEARLDPPETGREVSLRRALATSNNQCFAQLAVHAVGVTPLIQAIGRFGWLAAPAPAHAAGEADPGVDRFDVGRLGCGLAGCRITPLHAAQLAATLANGELVAPRWIERVWDPDGRELAIPAAARGREVLAPELASRLRTMLVDTTRSGTARRAFRRRNGHPLLGPVSVAGKTGSLSGRDPDGRYEWFVGVAPAEAPRIAIASVMVQGHLYWRTASQVAADVLERAFCEKGRCSAERVDRFLPGERTTLTRAGAGGS